jgi:hypothetical protein
MGCRMGKKLCTLCFHEAFTKATTAMYLKVQVIYNAIKDMQTYALFT